MGDSAPFPEQLVSLEPQVPLGVPLLETRRETPDMSTLFFPYPDPAQAAASSRRIAAFEPGQFVLVWLPGIDEKPYTISYLERDRFGITVLRRGVFSSALHELRPGAVVGFRGPYGRGFWNLEDSPDVAIIGGGCGMAGLAVLKQRLPQSTLAQGQPTAEALLYLNRFPDQIAFTEDGSAGERGLPTRWLAEALQGGGLRMVFTCGPEAMMAEVVCLCAEADVVCQSSLERYMKCGMGLCGQCECDGQMVCRDGPVFSGSELSKMPSFAKYARTKSGRRVTIARYGQCSLPPAATGNQGRGKPRNGEITA